MTKCFAVAGEPIATSATGESVHDVTHLMYPPRTLSRPAGMGREGLLRASSRGERV